MVNVIMEDFQQYKLFPQSLSFSQIFTNLLFFILQKLSNFLFKGNIAYDFFDNDLLYMTISEGFRRGGNNAVSTEAPLNNDESWIVYDSDRVLNYEAGIKGILNEIRFFHASSSSNRPQSISY